MNKKLLSLFLSFLLLGFVTVFAQEDNEEEIQAFFNSGFSPFAPQSVFEDGQQIYNSGWEWLHQQPNGNTLRWVKRWDASNWYAVGFAGTFIKTTDGGTNWFVNKMINGGGTTQSNYPLYGAHFFNMNTGIAVGGFGTCVITTDGGLNWDSLYNFPTAATAYDVFFVDDTLGFACGTTSMRIYKTTDGGLTWSQAWGNIPSVTCYAVQGFDANNIYIASSSGNFYKTTDGGTNWTSTNVGVSSTLYDLEFTDINNGWVCGSSGSAAYTTDGGVTWTNVTANVPVTSAMYDVDILSTLVQTLSTESFTDVTFPPAGWHTKNILGTNQWVRYTSYSNTPPACARISYQSTGGEDWLVTPQVLIAAGDTLKFFARKVFSSTYIPDTLQIRVSTTDTSVASFSNLVIAYDVNAFTTTFVQYSVDLSAFAGQNVYVAFRHFDFDGNGLAVDDISIGNPVTVQQVFLTGDAFDVYTSTNMGSSFSPISFLGPSQPWTSTYYSSDFAAPNDFVTVGGFGLINEVTPTEATTAHTMFIYAGTLYSVWGESSTGKVIAVGTASNTTTYDQAIYSTDGGSTWAVSSISDSADLDFNDISMVNSTTGYTVGEDHRVMKTTDGGATWFRVTDPATSTSDLETCYFTDANTGYVFGASGLGYKTTDGGTTWSPLTTGMGTSTIYGSHFLDAMTGYICGASGKIFYTTDGGATFTAQTSNNTSTIYSITFVNNNVGYCSGSSGRVRKTTDGGVTWDTVDVGNTSPTLYNIDFKFEDNGMTVGSTGRTYYTTDGGTTWNFENTSMSTVYGLFIERTSPDTSSAYVCGSNAYVMKNKVVIVPVELASFTASVNGSDVVINWVTATELNNLGFSIERRLAAQQWSEVGFVNGHGTTSEPQSYSFTDKGLPSGVYNYRIKQVDFDGSYRYYTLDDAVEIGAPVSYDLSQNYPNPFNPTTKIKYSVPADGLVNISVFNVLGEKVTDIVNSVHKAGSYEVTFDATNIATGMYIYRMESGNFVSVKKMMILK